MRVTATAPILRGRSRRSGNASNSSLLLLSFCFLAGALIGVMLGEQSPYLSEIGSGGAIYQYSSFPGLLFACVRYHLIVVFLAVSLLGTLLIPLLFAFRGFSLSCSAAALAAFYPDTALLSVIIVLFLPSLLTVTGLFLIGNDGLLFSRSLASVWLRGGRVPANTELVPHLLLSGVMCLLAAAAERYVIPTLVGLMI